MKKIHQFFFLCFSIFIATNSYCQQKNVTDFLNAPTPIIFDSTSYYLAWSSHPKSDYILQEYVPKGDSVERFHKMILLNFMEGDFTIDNIIAEKISELDKIKMDTTKFQPISCLQHSLFQNKHKKDEAVLDFFMTQNTQSGLVSMFEWNIYHYKIITDKQGRKGILLFGISMRTYGDETDVLFKTLKEYRLNHMLPIFMNYPVPAINPL